MPTVVVPRAVKMVFIAVVWRFNFPENHFEFLTAKTVPNGLYLFI